MKASPIEQTSCLEGFHSVLNQFSPKMIGYSYKGMFCRHVIAAIHFNKNLSREKKMKNGVEQYHIVHPKFMNGAAVVRNVPTKQNFDYVEEIFQTMVESFGTEKIKNATEELNNLTPPPMNTMLTKQPREEAIAKKRMREAMQLANVPPTNPVPAVTVSKTKSTKQRNPPKSSVCRQPMKGH